MPTRRYPLHLDFKAERVPGAIRQHRKNRHQQPYIYRPRGAPVLRLRDLHLQGRHGAGHPGPLGVQIRQNGVESPLRHLQILLLFFEEPNLYQCFLCVPALHGRQTRYTDVRRGAKLQESELNPLTVGPGRPPSAQKGAPEYQGAAQGPVPQCGDHCLINV